MNGLFAPTFLLHPSSEALLQPAVPALVPLVFVYHTLSAEPGKRWEKMEQPGWLEPRSSRAAPNPVPVLTGLYNARSQGRAKGFARNELNQRWLGPLPHPPHLHLGEQRFQTTHPARTVRILAVKA